MHECHKNLYEGGKLNCLIEQLDGSPHRKKIIVNHQDTDIVKHTHTYIYIYIYTQNNKNRDGYRYRIQFPMLVIGTIVATVVLSVGTEKTNCISFNTRMHDRERNTTNINKNNTNNKQQQTSLGEKKMTARKKTTTPTTTPTIVSQ